MAYIDDMLELYAKELTELLAARERDWASGREYNYCIEARRRPMPSGLVDLAEVARGLGLLFGAGVEAEVASRLQRVEGEVDGEITQREIVERDLTMWIDFARWMAEKDERAFNSNAEAHRSVVDGRTRLEDAIDEVLDDPKMKKADMLDLLRRSRYTVTFVPTSVTVTRIPDSAT